MRDSAFIVVRAGGIVKMVKSRPSKGKPHIRPALKAGEFAILVTIGVPDLAFIPRPSAEATLEVAVQKMVAPIVEVTQTDPPAGMALENDPDYQKGLGPDTE